MGCRKELLLQGFTLDVRKHRDRMCPMEKKIDSLALQNEKTTNKQWLGRYGQFSLKSKNGRTGRHCILEGSWSVRKWEVCLTLTHIIISYCFKNKTRKHGHRADTEICYNEVITCVDHRYLVLASSAHSVWSGSVGSFIFNHWLLGPYSLFIKLRFHHIFHSITTIIII